MVSYFLEMMVIRLFVPIELSLKQIYNKQLFTNFILLQLIINFFSIWK